MTLEKAIENLDRHFVLKHDVPRADLIESAGLGINALKRMKAERTIYGFKRHFRMPGETEE